MSRCSLIVALLHLLTVGAFGQLESVEQDSSRTTRSGIFPLPILFYTPETGIAAGAAVMYLYRDSAAARASTISGDIIYTEKRQIIVELSGDQYFSHSKYRLLSNLQFLKYPNKFFGIGNSSPDEAEENYTSQRYCLDATLYRRVLSQVNAGPAVHLEDAVMKKTDPSGKLASGSLPGSKGGKAYGAGFVVNWDSRDNTIATQSGSFYQLTALFYRNAFASDFSFTRIQVDAREFAEIVPEQILGIQAFGVFIDGVAPFHQLASFGGQSLVRGYFEGRYRDNNCIALQAEYRLPVWWRFGVVGFAGAAQVADRINRFSLKRFWLAGGAGLRFAWNPEERVNLRLDYGFGNNSTGMYITVTEAF
jgi:outer membrane protein assembly factor BamA